MQVKIEKTSPVQAKLKIQVPSEVVNQKLDAYFGRLAQRVKIAGFRPGKAPKDVVKRMYGEETAADLSERLISESVLQAMQEHKLSVVLPPVLLATDLPKEGQAFNFEVEVDLKPELPKKIDLKSLKIEAPKAPTEESLQEELKERIENLREREASFRDVSEKRPVKDGDCVVMSFDGTVDGVAREGMSAENHTLVLGRGQFLPDFEAAMIGMEIGQEKTAPVGFPEGYHEKSLSGKTAEFKIKLTAIKEKDLPELDDQFAKSSDPSVENLEGLKTKLLAEIRTARERSSRDTLRSRFGEALTQKYPLDLSPRLVEAETKRIAEHTHHMMHQMGVEHEENEEHAKSLMEVSRKKAEHEIRLSYLLEAIAEEQKIEVSDEDINRKLEDTAQKVGLSVSQLRTYYLAKDEESSVTRMDRLKAQILDEKSLDYALSQATIKNEG